MRQVAAVVCLVSVVPLGSPLPADAQAGAPASAGATISGVVTDENTGLAVSNASVQLLRGDQQIAATTTDSSGRYRFENEPSGVYRLVVNRSGYGNSQSEDVPLVPGQTAIAINLAIAQQTQGPRNERNFRTIGRVSADSTLGSLQRTSTVSRDLSSQTLLVENYANVAEGLNNLPGVNFSGHSSSVGDDTSISLRGFSPSEAQTLLDGHPIGPIGVGGGGFNFQVSPFYALRNTQVTFGAGALGLYGTDSTGGAIDLQTLSPTRTPEYSVTQGLGSQGKAFTAGTATGAYGKLGYALAGATQGTFGNFAPQTVTQSGLLGENISPSNIAGNTHFVSGAYNLRDALLKLEYTIAPGTVASVTGYSASSFQDKTGVGDNDFDPYSDVLANITTGTGGCPSNLVAVTVTDAGGIQCETPQLAAQQSSGPAGAPTGGAYETYVNQDYHGRLVSSFLGQTLSLDGYVDTYNQNYSRNHEQQNSQGIYTGGFYQREYKTNGFLVSDDVPGKINDFGFGYFAQHQTLDGNDFDTGLLRLVARPQAFLGTDNVFLRDTFTPTSFLTLYTNVYYKLLSTTGGDTVDPRLTLLLRPSPNDVLRFVAGKTDGEPAAILAQTVLNQTPSNLNPGSRCKSFIGVPGNNATTNDRPLGVGTLGAAGLQQETASDFEITYGHSFVNGSSFQIGGYDQREANLIQSANVPVPAGLIPSALLQAIYSRIRTSCGGTYNGTLADLALTQAFNGTTSGLFRGVELTARAYATRNLFFDLGYDLQQAQVFGYSDSTLAANPGFINGGQIVGVPLNKGSLALEYRSPRGFDARLDGYYFGINNPFNRPGYGYADAAFSYEVPQSHSVVSLGINNFTNSAVQQYGLINVGTPTAVNSIAGGTNPQEEFGLLPRTFLVTLTERTH